MKQLTTPSPIGCQFIDRNLTVYSLATFSGVPTINPGYFSIGNINRDVPPNVPARWCSLARELCYEEKGIDSANPPPFTYMLVYTGQATLADHLNTSAIESGIRYDEDPTRSHTLFSGYGGYYSSGGAVGILRVSAKDFNQKVVVLFENSKDRVILSGVECVGLSPVPIIVGQRTA